VLLDVGLPGMGGAEVCAAVRAEPRLAGLRVLAWTAGDEDALGALLAAGFDGLLAKPLRRDALLAALGLAPPG